MITAAGRERFPENIFLGTGNMTNQIEKTFIKLSQEWRDLAKATPKEKALPRQADLTALACLLIVVEWEEYLEESINSEVQENINIAESHWSHSALSEIDRKIELVIQFRSGQLAGLSTIEQSLRKAMQKVISRLEGVQSTDNGSASESYG